MPKQVVDGLIRRIIKDLQSNFNINDRYHTLSVLGKKFEVSYGCAAKAVGILASRGMLKPLPRSGIRVISLQEKFDISSKRIVVFSNSHDPEFNGAFLKGINEAAAQEKVSAELVENTFTDTRSVLLGDEILKLNADGVIALAFYDAALGFYHAMSHGMDLIADILHDELPQLPVVCSDDIGPVARAAQIYKDHKYEKVLLVTPREDDSFRGFCKRRIDGFLSASHDLGISVDVLNLFRQGSIERLDYFITRESGRCAVFSIEGNCNPVVASRFHQLGISVEDAKLLVFDALADIYLYKGLPPITKVGPSLRMCGNRLASRLIEKWKTGKFSEPLVEQV